MDNNWIYIGGNTAACRFAGTYLLEQGFPIADNPGPEVGHVLLDVPSFGPEGQLRMGGSAESLLKQLPKNGRIYGGNLNHPALTNYRIFDFLQDPYYLAENAYLTAECALDVALPCLHITLRHCPVLIIGWGRIGKCLAQLLKSIDAGVTVAARKESDRAMIRALNLDALDISDIPNILGQFRLIYNTVPSLLIPSQKMAQCREDCVCIDLASKPGMEHENVIIARGLPGIHFPESSGKLIGETFLRYYQEEV